MKLKIWEQDWIRKIWVGVKTKILKVIDELYNGIIQFSALREKLEKEKEDLKNRLETENEELKAKLEAAEKLLKGEIDENQYSNTNR